MTGARITHTLDDAPVRAALGRLSTALRGRALTVIGDALVETTQQRFDRGVDPSGAAWRPLHPAYAQIRSGRGILVKTGALRGSITRQVTGNRVVIGSATLYAGVHQSGATIRPKNGKVLMFRLGMTGPRGGKSSGLVRARSVTIPARPYLGFGAKDREAVTETLGLVVSGALRG